MPSNARIAFNDDLEDIEKLMELHEQEGGTCRGRRYNLEVLNKSAIVLIASYWEAYCEDIAAEALEHIIKYSKNVDALPKELRKAVAKELKNDKNELAIWEIADSKWKNYLRSRLAALKEDRNKKLNTPNSKNIDQLFESVVGITEVSSSWKWSRKMTVARAKTKLDKFITLRGSIAHRGKSLKSVTKADVTNYLDFIKRLAAKTGGEANSHVKKVTGKQLWRKRTNGAFQKDLG